MSAAAAFYPLVLEPYERELIWGGRALAERYGKGSAPERTIAESWECWEGNRILNGPEAGTTLGALCEKLGSALTGAALPASRFPLLTKFIDAREALSVQVHPGDAYAQRVEHQPYGKTECWLVLEASPGAQLVLGWTRDTSREEYLERVRDGSLDELLRRVDVAAGDVFHLPAGTMHAIGAGIVLFEVQQASDLTYRIYDYHRRGPDGALRELHVEKAADVLDYHRGTTHALAPLTYCLRGLERTALVTDAYFTVERVRLDAHPQTLDLDGAPLAVTALDRPVRLVTHGTSAALAAYQTAVIPAGVETIVLDAPGGEGSILTAAPLARRGALADNFSKAGVTAADSARFFSQF